LIGNFHFRELKSLLRDARGRSTHARARARARRIRARRKSLGRTGAECSLVKRDNYRRLPFYRGCLSINGSGRKRAAATVVACVLRARACQWIFLRNTLVDNIAIIRRLCTWRAIDILIYSFISRCRSAYELLRSFIAAEGSSSTNNAFPVLFNFYHHPF